MGVGSSGGFGCFMVFIILELEVKIFGMFLVLIKGLEVFFCEVGLLFLFYK